MGAGCRRDGVKPELSTLTRNIRHSYNESWGCSPCLIRIGSLLANRSFSVTDLLTTESAIENPKSALAEFLAASEPEAGSDVPRLISYCGVLTPQHLDAEDQESAALFQHAAVHDLGWLRRFAVRGEDRERWLSGMVTNSIEALEPGSGAYNLVLNAQGRIQGDLYVWRNGEQLELEIAANQSDALLRHFDGFIIMDDVELTPIEGVSALGLTGPKAAQVLASLSLPAPAEMLTSTNGNANVKVSGSTWTVPTHLRRMYGVSVPHYALWAKTEDIPKLWTALQSAGAKPAGAAAVETQRIVEGIPAYGTDIQSRDLAQETAQIRALHYSKGCYLGQEIVERIRSRGQVHRHLRALELSSASNEIESLPAVGSELTLDGAAEGSKPAATLTSAAALEVEGRRRMFAIAMVRAEAEVGNRLLVYPGGTATLLNAPPQFPAGQLPAEETA